MLTIGQYILRTLFYALSAYGAFLAIKIMRRTYKKKKIDNCAIYVVLSIMLMITLGNIIVFDIDMYNALLGTMQEHTVIYGALITLAGVALYFLTQIVNEKKVV